MTIPNLPTDNLYKFTFTAGIVLIVACLVLINISFNKSEEKIDAIEIEIAELGAETSLISQLISSKKNKQAAISEGLKGVGDSIDLVEYFIALKEELYRDKDLREYYSFLFKYEEKLVPHLKDLNESKALGSRIDSLIEISLFKKAELTAKTNLMENLSRRELLKNVPFLVGICMGFLMVYNGYKKWLIYVQKPLDEKLQLEVEGLRLAKDDS